MAEREQSEFNSAVSYLNRLNAIFSMADDSSMQLDVYSWFHALLVLYRELSTEFKADEKKRLKEQKTLIAEKVNEYISEQKRSGESDISTELYDMLDEFELSLRQIFKESGLQQKMQDSASKALK